MKIMESTEDGRVVHVLPCLLYFVGGFTVVLGLFSFFLVPLFDGRSGSDVIGEWLTVDESDVVSVGDPPLDGEPFLYEHFVPPDGSFGMGETTFKTVNWSYFKELFLAHTDWMMEYKLTSGSEWTETPYGEYWYFNRTWNESGFWKFDLILDVPVDIASARFTMGIDIPALQYVERDGWSVWLNYSVGENETYHCFFDWSDMAGIPGVVFNKGTTDDMFWFRFRKDDISAGHYEFDPIFGDDTDGVKTFTLENYIDGGLFTISEDGTADSISADIDCNYQHDVKCALYDSDSNLVATTEEKLILISDTWHIFNFSDPKPSLSSGESYYIVAWAESAYSSTSLRIYDTPSNPNLYYDTHTYGSWPDPASFTKYSFDDHTPCIYCTYTTSGGWTNTDPVISGEHPSNQSTGIVGGPVVGCTVADAVDTNQTFNVTFASNYSDGSTWVNYQTNSSVGNPGTVNWSFTGATTEGLTYYWKVFCHDGVSNVSETFQFTIYESTWNTVSNTINGSWVNATNWQTIIDTVNGSYGNVTVFKTVIDTINGSWVNSSTFDLVSNTINGSWSNVSEAWITVIDTINGSYSNSTDWTTLDDTVNGSWSNDTIVWISISTTINGSWSNTSLPAPGANITISSEYPGNNSVLFALQPTVYFTLDHAGNLPMNYTIYTGNTSENCTHLLGAGVLVGDGTYHYVNYFNASSYTSFYWRVSVTDDAGNTTGETFLFTSRMSGGGGMGGSSGLAAVGLCGILGLLGVFGFLSRRRKQ